MRFAVDSIIIGLLALRVLPGQKLSRIAESMLIALFSWSMLTGCSTQNAKTVETQKTVEYAADSDRAASAPVVSEKQTTKTEETNKSDGASVGVLSGTVHVVGEVLALPFRAVAGLINLVF
jgi:hypothetical protein